MDTVSIFDLWPPFFAFAISPMVVKTIHQAPKVHNVAEVRIVNYIPIFLLVMWAPIKTIIIIHKWRERK